MMPEEESILVVIATDDLVEGLTEMLSRSLVVTHTLGGELKRNSAIVVAKLRKEFVESSSSLKSTLEAKGTLEEKCSQISVEADEAKRKITMLETELQLEKADRAKVEGEKKMVAAKLEESEAFLLCISKNCFSKVCVKLHLSWCAS